MNASDAKSATSIVDMYWQLFLMFAVVVGTSMIPDAAYATPPNAIEQALCNVVVLMTSTTGKAIATIAVIVVGLGALMGKISWGMALIVALGIALVFGAASIVDAVGGGTTGAATCAGGQIGTVATR